MAKSKISRCTRTMWLLSTGPSQAESEVDEFRVEIYQGGKKFEFGEGKFVLWDACERCMVSSIILIRDS